MQYVFTKIIAVFLSLFFTTISFGQSGQMSSILTDRKASEERYSRVLDSWLNADINQLISQWGAPAKHYKMPNGNVIYTWVRSNTYTDTATVTPDGEGGFTIEGGGTTTYSCTTEFFTNPTGKIFDWKWRGNSCRQRK
jgi:hypothetical protein